LALLLFFEDLLSLDNELVFDDLKAGFEAFNAASIKLRLPMAHVFIDNVTNRGL
jgi:hypothetical protein